ncbi:beta-ketoacyl synthase chain length factor [Dyella acidiphila]|uniref:Beta-ketoacyl synthase chain length factor n=1 Tax=Dyella acidiphila TaxID=2775866 RepID=A0ABR9G7A3_9GAMM|nr:beta-ketoacyl synthase chain length factor [Dyella acidiphila]MBE1159934.1 beta-ketoacyl synthase chain length factor [Dyella acidiphila]
MNFIIDQWRAWAPGLDSDADWLAWSRQPVRVPDGDAQPSCDFLPPMQRRRLSRLARMTLHVAWPLCAEDEQLPFVFASRHGETPRTYALLSEVAEQQPLSPTQFGLSVHNAIAGQWSILRGQRGESVAIAGEADTFEHALVEASALLDDGAPAVLVVLAEEYPPEPYRDWIDDVPFSYALALRLKRAGSGEAWQLQLEPNREDAAVEAWPHALNVIRALQLRSDTLVHAWKTRRWIWQRIP